MSHVADMELHIKDLEALARAAKRLGMELVLDKKTFKWYGTHVGDYPLPAGFSAQDMGHCDHAMRVTGNKGAYEIGVCKRRDGEPGYQLLFDFFAGGFGLMEKIGDSGGLLKQAYALEVAKKQLIREGYRNLGEMKDKQGNVLLTFQE